MTLPKNILILTTPRTGSTTLLKMLSYDTKIQPEMFVGASSQEEISNSIDFYNFISGGDSRVVVKLMHNILTTTLSASQRKQLIEMIKLRNFYVIRLLRDDFKNQVFSMAIADTSNEFAEQTSKKIRCSHKTFKRTFRFIHSSTLDLNNNIYDIPIDQDIEFNDVANDNIVIRGHPIKRHLSKHEFLISADKEKKVRNLKDMDRWYEQLSLEYGYLQSPTNDL